MATLFRKHPANPVLPRTPDGWCDVHVANPDLLVHAGRHLLYFRGQGPAGHDQIGVAWAEPGAFDGVHWRFHQRNPIVPVASAQEAFDARHVLDPAAAVWNDRVHLYYSGHPREATRGPSIGLALSRDGLRFEKHAHNPVLAGALVPEVVVHAGRVHLFYQRRQPEGWFCIYRCASEDGLRFDPAREERVFGPSGVPGAFDAYSVSTARIWREAPWFYMTYGGCDRYHDYPVAIGLARSRDLASWERFPANPVLERGEPGAWDEGALWFATVHVHKGVRYLWYEGAGAGLGRRTSAARRASILCRESDYGGYAEVSFSQIGLATHRGDLAAAW